MKHTNFLLRIVLLCLVIALVSMGCPGPDSNPPNPYPSPNPNTNTTTGVTTFSGGSLADLKSLSPDLTFDQLEITGNLDLPHNSSTTITANKLTITPSGSIGYSYDNCTYVAAPHLTLSVSGDVVIDGKIYLSGRNGKVVYSLDPSCDSPYGQDGGNVTITGNTIKVTGEVSNAGGEGGLLSSSSIGGIHEPAGDSGNLKLAATTTLDLSGATINNKAGVGLDASKNGLSGTVIITAGGAFIMRDGNIDSTGAMTFSAASTDIWGTIHYGTLNESIGGAPDTTNPTITLVSNLTNTSLTYHTAIEVKVEASDVGMGLKGIQLVGLGNTTTYYIANCKAGSGFCTTSALDSTITMSVTVNHPSSLQALQLTAIDNKGNTTNAPLVTDIAVHMPLETEPNDSMAQAQELELGGIFDGTIQNDDPGTIWAPGTQPVDLNANSRTQYKIEDFYKVQCCKIWNATPGYNCFGNPDTINMWVCYGIEISLDFTGSASVTPDLDVYLLNNAGTSVVALGGKDNVQLNDYTESFRYVTDHFLAQYYTPGLTSEMGHIYYVGIQAWEVPTRAMYRIQYGP
jgi:hypothetical protein